MPGRELCTGAAGKLGAEAVANVSRPSLNVAFARRAGVLDVKFDAKPSAELATELLIPVRFVTQPIVDVQRSNVVAAAQLGCNVEQADRIAAAGETDNDFLPRFKQPATADSLEQLIGRRRRHHYAAAESAKKSSVAWLKPLS